MSSQLLLRDVPDELSRELESLSAARGLRLDQTVLEILGAALDPASRRKRLQRLATWTAADAAEFDAHLAEQRRIDDELWR